jgi:Bacterial Ig domain/Purple acid Phosphatase, N-terminal domain/Abnormal spindle-like microcephaly-assoc'd, ASPM-SPD-2-Hydin
MPRMNTRSAITGLGLTILLEILLVTSPGTAGILDATWTAPTTNTDGSPLTDLQAYRIYYGTSSAPCLGSSVTQIASPTSSPGPSQTVSLRLSGLTIGSLYNVAVTAVDAVGNESACSGAASAVARADFAVNPSGTVSFGGVNLGSFTEKAFVVSNSGGGTISGAVSVAAPFTVTSGSPFSLNGVGTSQTVTVRFTPTTTTTVSASLNFATGGGTISPIVTGSGIGSVTLSDTTPPTIALTAPAASSTVTSTVAVSGIATDNVGVAGVQFRLDGVNLGAEVATSPSTVYTVTWNTTTAPDGGHVLTAVARDAAGNKTTSAPVNVTVANAAAVTGGGATGSTAPVISGVSLSVTKTGATVGWTTNKPSDSQLVYGLAYGLTTTSYGNSTTPDQTLVTSHLQTISGLTPNTWYHFRIKSNDAVSADFKFKTRNR